MDNRAIEVDIRYCAAPFLYGRRYEVFIAAYNPLRASRWKRRGKWLGFSYSAKPTPKQVRKLKQRCCKCLARTPRVIHFITDECVVSTETAIAGVFVSDKGYQHD